MRRVLLALALFLCCAVQTVAQERFGVAYYDVDKLYDTIPSKFYDDRAYTPNGKLGWNTERYRRRPMSSRARTSRRPDRICP